MAEVREQRKASREKRRARLEEPFEQLDAQVGPQVKRAAVTAAAAALAGALAGGAKALADRRGRSETPERPDEEREEEPESEGQSPSKGWGQTPSGSDPSGSDLSTSTEPEPVEADEGGEPDHGAESGEVAEIIEHAREHVHSVLGSEAETVSGIERSNGHWCVSVEVVQLRRVPESTDVLASYAVVVDDDGGLISLRQARRYRRSQADDGR